MAMTVMRQMLIIYPWLMAVASSLVIYPLDNNLPVLGSHLDEWMVRAACGVKVGLPQG